MSFERITTDPNKMGGLPCIRDLRMPVATIINKIAAGMSEDEILEDFPELEQEDIREALRYAAALLNERHLPLVTP